MTEEDIKSLQSELNKVGAMLKVDGNFGKKTTYAVRYVQRIAHQNPTGIADEELLKWLKNKPCPFEKLTTEGVTFIAREEVGSLNYYHARTKYPHYPGLKSGVTIGIGYDLKHKKEQEFENVWKKLPESHIYELKKHIGKYDSDAKHAVEELKKLKIEIPFEIAWAVFTKCTLPEYYEKTKEPYPSIDNLPELCRTVLVSIVYNRGSSIKDTDRRKEMREISIILKEADMLSNSRKREKLTEVTQKIRDMKRLWPDTPGLQKRREREAILWDKGLSKLNINNIS